MKARRDLARAIGPELQLFDRLNKWSLNAYKDRSADWPETLSATPFDTPGFFTDYEREQGRAAACSYGEYEKKWRGTSLSIWGDMTRFGVYALSRAGWTQQQVDGYIAEHGVLMNPLVGDGYPSIGCATCTMPVQPGADPRSGRWPGTGKTECGLHT